MKSAWKYATEFGAGVLLAGLCLAVVGCASMTRKADMATKKVEQAKAQERTLEDRKENTAKAYVYGAGEALRSPQGVDVASGLVRRAALTLGPPSMEDARSMDNVVSGLLSEEQTARKVAEARLAVLDARVVGLERQLSTAQKNTERAEEKRDGVLEQAASFAEKYLTARRWVWGLVIGFVAWKALPLILQLAGVFAGGPLGGAIAGALGNVIRSISSAVPNALEKAGAVAASEHARVSKSLENVVVGVERYKKQHPDAKAKLAAILLDETSREDDRPVIEAIVAKNKTRIK